jgi:hypothetical protein
MREANGALGIQNTECRPEGGSASELWFVVQRREDKFNCGIGSDKGTSNVLQSGRGVRWLIVRCNTGRLGVVWVL